jgi:hypothetical protein
MKPISLRLRDDIKQEDVSFEYRACIGGGRIVTRFADQRDRGPDR